MWPDGWYPEGWDLSASDEDEGDSSDEEANAVVASSQAPECVTPLDHEDDYYDYYDSDDATEDEVLASYLCFRAAFKGSKHQRKMLTLDRYIDLSLQAQVASMGLHCGSREDVVLTQAHLDAFRACGENYAVTLPESTPVEVSASSSTVTVEPTFIFSPHASVVEDAAPSTLVPQSIPEVSASSTAVTVEPTIIYPPHASAADVAAPSITQPQPHGRRWRRRHKA